MPVADDEPTGETHRGKGLTGEIPGQHRMVILGIQTVDRALWSTRDRRRGGR
jgi:hypothetical protein